MKEISINNHPLKEEIISKIESGEIVISSGPIDKDFKWTKEKEKELEKAIERVKELNNN